MDMGLGTLDCVRSQEEETRDKRAPGRRVSETEKVRQKGKEKVHKGKFGRHVSATEAFGHCTLGYNA